MRIHFMGSAHVQRTACGRYVAPTGSRIQWSADTSAVTCERCRELVGA